MPEHTDRELMVIAAGREIHDGDLVFAGMRLPGGAGWRETPTAAELEIVLACDPAGFWTR